MKTTLISTSAMQNAVRLAIQRAQSEVTDRQVEVTTGRHADIGLALGSKSARTISLNRDVARFDSILDSNALVSQRLSSSQEALGQMVESAQIMLDTLITVKGTQSRNQLDVAEREMRGALQNFTSLANMSSTGEFLFAGVNTDVQPMKDYLAPGSDAKVAFDAAFSAYFGFTQDDPATDTITSAQMGDFLDNHVEPMFQGAAWTTNWSRASDTNMSSRITNTEVIDSSTNANEAGFRDFALAAVVGVELLGMDLGGTTRDFLDDRMISYAGNAIAGLNTQRAQMGVSEGRVTKANEALQAQKDVVATYIGELEGVDPYEASVQMNTLLTQMEASYALTARIQQMTLLNYL